MIGVSLAFAATLAGLVVGLVHFAALRRTVDRYSAGRGRLAAAALTLGRIAGTTYSSAWRRNSGRCHCCRPFWAFYWHVR
jgi:hypothetical protein